jgi:hypothetical protein
MNDRKLNQLFDAARRETPPSPAPGFDHRVLAALRREAPSATGALSLLDQLGAWFPRLAWAATLVVALSVASDFSLRALGVPGLAEGVARMSEQWLFAGNGF